MSEIQRLYRGRYVYTPQFGNYRHSYEIIGRWGGLHFHAIDLGEEYAKRYGNRYAAGLETHYRQPPNYMQNKPPSHDDCWLLKAPCWHDGTSNYAQETLLPMMLSMQPDHDAFLGVLMAEANERFEEFQKLATDA